MHPSATHCRMCVQRWQQWRRHALSAAVQLNFQSASCARGQRGHEAKRSAVHHLSDPVTTSDTGWSTAAYHMHAWPPARRAVRMRQVFTCLRGSLTAVLRRRRCGMKGRFAQTSLDWSGRLARTRRSPARTAPRHGVRAQRRAATCAGAILRLKAVVREVARRSVVPCTTAECQRSRSTRVGAPPRVTRMIDSCAPSGPREAPFHVRAQQLGRGLEGEERRDERRTCSNIVSLVGATHPDARQPDAYRSSARRARATAGRI